MKKLSVFTVFFISLLTYSQTYSFDFLTKYALENADQKYNTESINYFNSDDFSYFLKVTKVPDQFTATLYDTTANMAHRFTVKESRAKGEVFFSFDYEYSYPLKSSRFNDQNYHITFGEISESSPKKVSMKVFRTKNAKKPLSEHLLTLQPANKNLFPIYRVSRTSLFGFMSGVNFPGEYIVVKDSTSEGKVSCEFILKEHKNVELTVTLPQKLKL